MGFIKHFYSKSFEAYRCLGSSYPEIAFFSNVLLISHGTAVAPSPGLDLMGLTGTTFTEGDSLQV